MSLSVLLKRGLVRLLRALIPYRVYRVARSEWGIWVSTRGSRLPAEFATGTHYVNAGCGTAGRPGWLNIDLTPFENVALCWDLREGLPGFLRGRVKGLFTEHMLEHLDRDTEVPRFLQSVRDALVPGGVIRVVVPDAGRYLQAYVAPGWDLMAQARGLGQDRVDPYSGVRMQTKLQLVNEVFRQGGGHLYAWDAETLILALEEAGFVEVRESAFMQGADPALLLDLPGRRSESLYVEGRRAPSP